MAWSGCTSHRNACGWQRNGCHRNDERDAGAGIPRCRGCTLEQSAERAERSSRAHGETAEVLSGPRLAAREMSTGTCLTAGAVRVIQMR
jgi:hypothetical protein